VCNLYSLTTTQTAMRQLFGVKRDSLGNHPPLPAIFPGHDAPVVRLGADGDRELTRMHWGFVLPQKGRVPKDVTNARDDKVRVSRFWASSFEARRCLVPVTSFCEPKGRRPAIWHWFAIMGDEPRPLFAFAGIWRPWRGDYRGDPVEMEAYAFLTTVPNEIIRPVHPNRMPVILRSEDHETWLTGSPDEAFALARPYPAAEMQIVRQGEGEKADPVATA
jgi:putative SOS response-associated peptidase YedK